MSGSDEQYVDATDAARRLGCSRSSVCRAARATGVGVYVRQKLVAIPVADLPKLRPAMKATPGNPDWIAAAKKPRG